jgi:hypothetical protein
MVWIDQTVTAEVGSWYLSTSSMPGDREVVAAYEQLQRETDRIFSNLMSRRNEQAIQIVFTYCLQPYADAHELIESVQVERMLEVTTAAVHGGKIHPLLSCEFGGAFDRFRAVHDLIGHGRPGFNFELQDEVAAWRVQDRFHRGIARWALATEICGVNSARWITGDVLEAKALPPDPHVAGWFAAIVQGSNA